MMDVFWVEQSEGTGPYWMGDMMIRCPYCHATQQLAACFMGCLGGLRHFRCRYCGAWWYRQGPNYHEHKREDDA